jgi:hypothetical protein
MTCMKFDNGNKSTEEKYVINDLIFNHQRLLLSSTKTTLLLPSKVLLKRRSDGVAPSFQAFTSEEICTSRLCFFVPQPDCFHAWIELFHACHSDPMINQFAKEIKPMNKKIVFGRTMWQLIITINYS